MNNPPAAEKPADIDESIWAVLDEDERSWCLDDEEVEYSFYFTYEDAERTLGVAKLTRPDLADVPCPPGAFLHNLTFGLSREGGNDGFECLDRVDMTKCAIQFLEELRDRLASTSE